MSSSTVELQLSEITLGFQSSNKHQRLVALEKLRKATDKLSKQEIATTFNVTNKFLAKLLTDPSEACRNATIDVIKYFLEVLPAIEKQIVYIIPVLVRRLAPQEIHETSEEVRLNCVELVRLIIRHYHDHLTVYVDDFMAILVRTVADNYAKVKRESCEAIVELARTVPVEFYAKSDAIVKPILGNFSHQHYRVRVSAIKAIGDVLQYGNSKLMEQVSTPMAERLFDASPAVRAAVIEVAGSWLVNLRDRYSWWYKLIPLLLTGLHDEIPEIRERAGELWDATGKLYLRENETDEKIKDKMDFLTDNPRHYPPIERPNLGCRIIVQQNIGRLIGGIGRELNDWMADIRVRSAQLLAVLVLNVEADIIQHIEKLLPALYRACNDEDERVVVNVILAAEYLGYFVPTEVYLPLVLPTLDGNITAGHLTVLAAILRGSERNQLTDKLVTVGNFLAKPHICRSKRSNYQREILRCVEALLAVCHQDCAVISDDLFITIVTVWSAANDETIRNSSKILMESLAEANSTTIMDLYSREIREILHLIKTPAWNVYSCELQILKFCLTEANNATADSIDLLLPILRDTMTKESDPELRIRLFILLSEFFQQSNVISRITSDLQTFASAFTREILMPGMIWCAGKAAEAMRTAATACFCALFEKFASVVDKSVEFTGFDGIFHDLRPILLSLVDDNSRKSRLYALRGLCLTLDIIRELNCIREEDIMVIYPVIMKRLDDSCNDVRWAAVEALVHVWRGLPSDYDVEFGKSHVDYLYTSMIVHLDDPESDFQQLMLDSMMELAKVHPLMLANKINKCKNNFRNQSGLDKLLKHCQELLSADIIRI